MLVRLAPLRTRNDDGTVERAAALRRRRRTAGAIGVPLVLLLVGAGTVAAVLTGAATRGDASVLLGAVAAAGLAELLRRRLGRDAGTVDVQGTSTLPAAGGHDEPAHARASGPDEAVPFTGVWSARGAIRRDVRRMPPTRCALPPARMAAGLAPQPEQEQAAPASPGEVSEASPSAGTGDDIDLTREVLAALHAGSEA